MISHLPLILASPPGGLTPTSRTGNLVVCKLSLSLDVRVSSSNLELSRTPWLSLLRALQIATYPPPAVSHAIIGAAVLCGGSGQVGVFICGGIDRERVHIAALLGCAVVREV